MKRDGHTHTEFCPHGSGEAAELLIQKAIKQGFTHYSVTEHAPLPNDFMEQAKGEDDAIATASMAMNDIDNYFKEMQRLKIKYASQIQISVGLEVDYLPGFESWTTGFLNEYGKQLDDSILSLHFLKGTDGYRCIDYSASDYEVGIVDFYSSFQKAQEMYFEKTLQMIQADLGVYKPKRMGHITLCQKFKNYFKNEETSLSNTSLALIDEIIDQLKTKNYEIDFNTAGLYKVDCQETYPNEKITKKIINSGIPLVFGSDAHSTDDVGRSYEVFERLN